MNSQIHQLLQNLTDLMANNKLLDEQKTGNKSINVLCMLIIIAATTMTFINYIEDDRIGALLSFLFVITFSIPIIFNVFHRKDLARIVILIGGLISVSLNGILYGGLTDLEYLLLLIPVGSLLTINNKAYFFISLVGTVLLFIGIKLIPNFYAPILENKYPILLQILVGLTMLSLFFIILSRFIQDNLTIRKKMEATLTELTQANKALALREAQYKAIFDNAFDGIILVDLASQDIVSYNQKILDILDVPDQIVLQGNVSEYLTKQGLFDLNHSIKRTQQDGVFRDKVSIKMKNNQEIYAEVSSVVLPGVHEHLAVTLFRDISLEIEAQTKLMQANQELKNFAHAASHDLKEPLRMIQSFGQLLHKREHQSLTNESKEFLGYIINSSKRMTQLVNDLLEYSTTDTQNIELRPIDLNNIAAVIQNNLRLKIAETNTTISIHNLPTILGNGTQMIQVFQNMVANAIKFQKKGNPPVINISSSTFNGQHLIRIKDNGIGIAKEYQEQVFGIFKRLHSKQDYDGSGIGLATCKKIIEKMGGQIWVESGLGQGTAFFFTVPMMETSMNYEHTPANLQLVDALN